MSRIPCKRCPNCGTFNDFTVEVCNCGTELDNIATQVVETNELTCEQRGIIDVELSIYVQQCPACGTLNYTDRLESPVSMCCNCNRNRIARIKPIPFNDDGEIEPREMQEMTARGVGQLGTSGSGSDVRQVNMQASQSQQTDNKNEDFEQLSGILANIKKIAAGTNQYDDEDDDDEVTWDEYERPAQKSITLTSTQYGGLSFTVEREQSVYMLGRSANQSDFLSRDKWVGNEHCCLLYRNGNWFVKDNNSKNGTLVNRQPLNINGECKLNNNDELVLGHNGDSIAFIITINE